MNRLFASITITMLLIPTSSALAAKKPSAPFVNGQASTYQIPEDQNANTTSATFPHTVNPGRNQLLVVTMGTAGGTPGSTSVTYAGIPMKLGNAHGTDGFVYHEYWYLVNPPTGTHDVVATFPTANGRIYGAVTFANVDTKKPFDNDAHIGGSNFGPDDAQSAAVNVSTTLPNELIFYFIQYGGSNATFVPDDPAVYEARTGYGNTGAARVEATSGVKSVGGIVNRNGGGSVWELVAVPIRPAK